MEYFFKTDIIDLLVDFVFGERKPGDVQMGGSYAQPNFTPLNKVITLCLSQTEMIKKYEKQAAVNQLMTKSSFLKKALEENVEKDDFAQQITDWCKENFKMSKKLSKIFLKAFAMTANIQKYLKAVKKFLCIKDSM